MTFLKIAWKDFQEIITSRLKRVILIAVLLIPMLYSSLFLYAFKDPYGQMQDLPIAVVNDDKPAYSDGNKINAGDDLIKELKNNHQYKWEFVSNIEADEGLEGKKYYTKIYIPSDFSKNLATVNEKKQVKAKLIYSSNEKRNYISSQVMNTTVFRLRDKMQKKIINEFVDKIFDNINNMGKNLKKLQSGSQQIHDRLVDVKEGLATAKKGTATLNNGLLQVKNGTALTYDKLIQAQNGAKQLNEGAKQLREGAEKLNSGTEQVSSGTALLNKSLIKASDGANTLKKGSSQLKSGLLMVRSGTLLSAAKTAQAASGVKQLKDGFQKLSKGATQLKDGNGLLLSKFQLAEAGAKQLASGLYQLDAGGTLLKVMLPSAKVGLDNAKTGAGQLRDGAKFIASKIGYAKTGSIAASNGAKNLYEGLRQLYSGINAGDASGNAPSLMKGSEDLYNGLSTIEAGSKSLDDGINNSSTGLVKQVQDMEAAVKAAAQSNDPQTAMRTINMLNSKLQDANLNNQLKSLSTGSKQLSLAITASKDGAKSINQGINKISVGLIGDRTTGNIGLVNGAKLLYSGLVPLETGIGAAVDGINRIDTGADKLYNGIDQLSVGMGTAVLGSTSLSDGLKKADAGAQELSSSMTAGIPSVKKLADGSAQLNSGMAIFGAGLNTLYTGLNSGIGDANKLAAGAAHLSDGMNKLDDGIGQIASGLLNGLPNAKKLALGAAQLNNGAAKFNDGAFKLNIGTTVFYNSMAQSLPNAKRLATGTAQLYKGATSLSTGLQKLYDGSSKLAVGAKTMTDKISDGRKELSNSLIDRKAKANMISKPVAIEEHRVNPVPNYGTGFAGYFISLSLWVGALLLFFVVSMDVDEKIRQNASNRSVVLGKFFTIAMFGFIQAVGASSIIVFALNIHVKSVLLFYGFNILISFAFIAIIQCFIMLFDNAGRFISIVLLLLQLTSCGGAFPVELTPKFFRVLNPYLPMAYSVNGIREVVSGINYSNLAKDAIVLAVLMVAFMGISNLLSARLSKIAQAFKSQDITAA